MLRALPFAIVAVLSLGGCSALDVLNQASAPLDVCEIRAPRTAPAARAERIDFIVEEPTASAVINTDRILVRPSSAQVQYLPDARWSETAPAMIRSAIVDGFERMGAFRYVGRTPLSSSGDVALVMNLTEFHAEIPSGDGAGTVRITLVARLVREDGAEILSRRTFTAAAALPDTSTETIVAAFEAVTQNVLSDLAQWVLKSRGIPLGST